MTGDMTAQQAEALAAYLHTKRPGERAWTRSACIDALRVAFREITSDCQRLEQAALNAVNDPNVRTPAVIGMKGRHWELGADLDKRREGTKGVTCVRCRRTYMAGDGHDCVPPATPERIAAIRKGELE